jgi:two-component system, response regulator YesN
LKIRKYVEEHLSGDLSLASLGDQVYFNPKYLSKMFKQVTGSNYLSYINDLKLSRVKELLNMNDTKISEIGAQVGFLSAPYFTRFFKKATGMTPQEYRSRIIANKVEKG